MIGDIVGKNSGLFLDLAVYSIIAENNAGQYYPDYVFNHPLFTDRMKIYSDSKVSDFINSITRDQSLAFLDEWNEKQHHSQKIYISYDSTNKNCQAGDIDFVEYGHPKEDTGAPVIKYIKGLDGYHGTVLLVGISYEKGANGENNKKHSCVIEKVVVPTRESEQSGSLVFL